MKLKIKPSARIKKRYLLLEGNENEVKKAILEYIGILGWAKASAVFLKNKYKDKTILSVDRNELIPVRAAIESYKEKIKILNVSGTLKGLNLK